MYSGNRNLILYDGDFIVFHNYDILDDKLSALTEDELSEIDTSMRQKFMMIVSEIEKQEAQTAADQWRVVGPQVVALNNMGEEGSKEFVNNAKTDLMSIVSQRGLGLDDTFGDYIGASVREEIMPKLNFDQQLSPALIDAAIASAKSPEAWSLSPTIDGQQIPVDSRERMRFLKAMHGGSKADRKVISQIFSKSYGTALQKIILEPFAQFAVAYTSKILDGVESNFMVDNKQGQKVFIETVNMAIEHFKQKFKKEADADSDISKLRKIASDDSKVSSLDRKSRAELKKAIEASDKFKLKYETQMGRLVAVDKITTPVEGVVFEYPPGSNKYYKFTGGFAASNQLLGMLGWADKERISKEARTKVVQSKYEEPKALNEAEFKSLIRRALIAI
jgi:ribosomal protein L24